MAATELMGLGWWRKGKMLEQQAAFPGQAILMLSVALDGLRLVEAEPDLAKVRTAVASVEDTLKELLALAKKATG